MPVVEHAPAARPPRRPTRAVAAFGLTPLAGAAAGCASGAAAPTPPAR
jgi:hypothetical protein